MDVLGKIFGSQARVKLMRLFLFHEGKSFPLEEITKRTLLRRDTVRRELKVLESIGFLKKGNLIHTVRGKRKIKKRRVSAWRLNPRFELKIPLRTLLIETQLIREKDILSMIRRAGKLKLLVLSGLFVRRPESEVDMLIVIDSPNKRELERSIKKIESEIGKELLYAVFSMKEFRYRLDMYDKLVRDVLENEKSILFDRTGIPWKS